jgi:multicomponent Na+:H+ antiporter subunit B
LSSRVRIGLFLAGGAGLGALLLWGLAGLPSFGDYPGPYGDLIAQLAQPQRHIANAVTAVVFDYRGFDTMGEELLLFAAATSVALLLRETREEQSREYVEAVRSDALNAVGALTAIVTLVLALNVIAHGMLTPGGGFQGGVVLAAAFVLLFLTVDYRTYSALSQSMLAEPFESFGAGAYVGLGLLSFAFGLAFLQNFMELGVFGRLSSGGSAILVNWASAFAVAGGFLVVFGEYLQENVAERHRR